MFPLNSATNRPFTQTLLETIDEQSNRKSRFGDAEGDNTSGYSMNVNVHTGLSVLPEYPCTSWRLAGD
jgi:hypothetical protein